MKNKDLIHIYSVYREEHDFTFCGKRIANTKRVYYLGYGSGKWRFCDDTDGATAFTGRSKIYNSPLSLATCSECITKYPLYQLTITDL